MKTTKVIFLDVDGVFTSMRTGWYNWDIYAVNFFIWLCKQTNSSIVISSSWRLQRDKKFFDDIFPKCIHDDWKTNKKLSSTRGQEISMWLSDHKEVVDYLIIDDMDDMLREQFNHLILTDPLNGLNDEHIKKILEYFKITDYPNYYKSKPSEIYIHKNMFDDSVIIKFKK